VITLVDEARQVWHGRLAADARPLRVSVVDEPGSIASACSSSC